MEEEYWLKCGFKENGELTCLRLLSHSKPNETFYYTENGEYKKVKNTIVIKLTKEFISPLNGLNSKDNVIEKK